MTKYKIAEKEIIKKVIALLIYKHSAINAGWLGTSWQKTQDIVDSILADYEYEHPGIVADAESVVKMFSHELPQCFIDEVCIVNFGRAPEDTTTALAHFTEAGGQGGGGGRDE